MYCTNCGLEIPENVKFCEYCGAEQSGHERNHTTYRTSKIEVNVTSPPPPPPYYEGQQVSSKSRLVLLLLWFFFGIFGVHYFYAERIGMGLLWLFTGGFFGIGWCIDLIVILSGSFQDSHGRPIINF